MYTLHLYPCIRLRTAIIFCFCFFISFTSRGTEKCALTVGDGLYNNQTRQLVELPGGQILVETEGMFNLFNGIRFVQQEYNLKQTLPMLGFGGCIHWTDRQGMLWLKDYYHLYIYDPEARQFRYDAEIRLKASGVSLPELKNLCIDADSTAWLFTTDGRLLHFDWKNRAKLAITLTKEELAAGISITNVLRVSQELYLFFLNTGVVRHWDTQSRKIVAEDRALENRLPISDHCLFPMMWDNKQTAVIATNKYFGGLYRYDIAAKEWTLLLQTRVNSMERLKDGGLLVASNDGLYILRDEQITGYEKIQGTSPAYPMGELSFAHQDRQGGLWLGTKTKGIIYQHPPKGKAQLIQESNAFPFICMERVADYLLLGTSKGIFFYDTESHAIAPVPGTSAYDCLATTANPDGSVYVGTKQGMLHVDYDKVRRKWEVTLLGDGRLKNQLHSHFRFALPIDKERLLTCNVTNALGYIYLTREEFVCLNDKLKKLDEYRMPMGTVRLNDKNRVLIYAQNGIFVLDTQKDEITPFSPVDEMLQYSNKFNCAVTDSYGRLWLGTQNGLLMLPPDLSAVRRFTASDGLSNSCIQSIIEDGKGRLWVGTAHGISRITFTPTDTLITCFGPADGIPTAEMIERSVVIMPDEKVYFANMEGIVTFRTDVFDNNLQPMPVVLTGFSVCNRRQPLDLAPISLSHKENYLSFQFSCLNYANPTHTHYRYRLSGLDRQWITNNTGNGLGEAHYNALSPGNYVLEVQAAIGDGKWGPVMQKSLLIRPPFWLTWWAKTFYTLLFFSLLLVTQTYYLRKKEAKMERENDNRVNRLFELREEARHQFAEMSNVDPVKIAVNAEEEMLVNQMMKAIGENMANADYNVDLLARDIAISRTNLYKKMQNMLGITPTDFIRNIRLKHAALLLVETEYTIHDIAIKVGFNTVRNFSGSFKKMFGITPSEYRHGKKEASS